MNLNKRVIIVGHPGAGKALLAKTLAEKLGWQFIDADFGLEFKTGKIIDEIFKEPSSHQFYKLEHEVLINSFKTENVIINTDPSIICDENIRSLLENEFVVYLQVSTKIQLERLLKNPSALLEFDAEFFLEKLHHQRDDLYEKLANFSINSDDSKLDHHVLSIEKMILNVFDINKNNLQLNLPENALIFFHKNLHTPVHLTLQQGLVFKFLAEGKSSKEIANIVNISYRTVEGHIAKIMEILGCDSSKELIALYHQS